MTRTILYIATFFVTASAFFYSVPEVRAQGVVVVIEQGIVCDRAEQIAKIVSQYGQKPLQQVVDSLNQSTGKRSCGIIQKRMVLMAEPVRIVDTPIGQMKIMKLTTYAGHVQYAWEEFNAQKIQGQPA